MIWFKRLYWLLVRRDCTWCGSCYRGACTHMSRKIALAMSKALRDPNQPTKRLPPVVELCMSRYLLVV